MFARFRSRRIRGISLSEAMVSLLILTMVMIVALTLLFTMKSFAERQQVKTAPRQTSRRAIDYLSTHIAGATDLNDNGPTPSPNALIAWYAQGNSNTPVQATYNNVTDGRLAEPGTDILTLAAPIDPFMVPISRWVGWQKAANLYFHYTEGCPSDETMRRNFLQLTGASSEGNDAQSIILTLVDRDGRWAYYEITGYQDFSCTPKTSDEGTPYNVHVVSNPGQSQRINPPGGHPDLNDPALAGGMRIYSFRVRRDANGILNLEQKQGLFNPATDNPGTAFTPIMPDVEDLQIAYLYSRPPDPTNFPGRTVFNTFDAATGADVRIPATGNVPPQAAVGSATPWDITMVSGIRISITSRSIPLRFEARNASARRNSSTTTLLSGARPRSEDRAPAAPSDADPTGPSGVLIGDFDHHRMTSTVLIRNRMLGN